MMSSQLPHETKPYYYQTSNNGHQIYNHSSTPIITQNQAYFSPKQQIYSYQLYPAYTTEFQYQIPNNANFNSNQQQQPPQPPQQQQQQQQPPPPPPPSALTQQPQTIQMTTFTKSSPIYQTIQSDDNSNNQHFYQYNSQPNYYQTIHKKDDQLVINDQNDIERRYSQNSNIISINNESINNDKNFQQQLQQQQQQQQISYRMTPMQISMPISTINHTSQLPIPINNGYIQQSQPQLHQIQSEPTSQSTFTSIPQHSYSEGNLRYGYIPARFGYNTIPTANPNGATEINTTSNTNKYEHLEQKFSEENHFSNRNNHTLVVPTITANSFTQKIISGANANSTDISNNNNNNNNSNSTSNSSYIKKNRICPICQKIFNRPSGLKTHMHIHTGEKPYKCEWPNCGKKFSVRSNMIRHNKIHKRQEINLFNKEKTKIKLNADLKDGNISSFSAADKNIASANQS